jgi:hypothetical protein
MRICKDLTNTHDKLKNVAAVMATYYIIITIYSSVELA